MGDENIYPVPKIELFLADLVEVAQAPELAEVGLEGMREDLVLREDAPLIIKPSLDGCSTGIMQLQHPGDLVAYATAVAQQWDEIPAELSPGVLPSRLGVPVLSQPSTCWSGNYTESGSGAARCLRLSDLTGRIASGRWSIASLCGDSLKSDAICHTQPHGAAPRLPLHECLSCNSMHSACCPASVPAK